MAAMVVRVPHGNLLGRRNRTAITLHSLKPNRPMAGRHPKGLSWPMSAKSLLAMKACSSLRSFHLVITISTSPWLVIWHDSDQALRTLRTICVATGFRFRNDDAGVWVELLQ